LKNQLGQAGSLDALYAVIIGEDELKSGMAIIKEMESGEQKKVPLDWVVEFITGILFGDSEDSGQLPDDRESS
jgi:histidyl-tRNA synthetase